MSGALATPRDARSGDRPGTPALRWIVSPRYDLCFFIGSCVLTFAFFGLYRGAQSAGWLQSGQEILLTYFVFTALFDHPHIFQTLSRTHGDREEFERHRGLHTWGIAAFVAAGLLVIALGWEPYLIVGAAVFGTWHIIRQHAGFLKIYKGINQDRAGLDNLLDYGTFYVGTFACFLHDYSGVHEPIWIYGDLTVPWPNLPGAPGEWLWRLFMLLLVALVARQFQRVATGRRVNAPKLLLLGAALGTHYFVFFATATPFLIAEALETAYHDAQYQGWVMHYQRRRFGVPRLVWKWGLVAVAYGLCVGALEILGLMRPQYLWLFVPFSMLVIWHYYVDGKIWKFSENPELRALLAPEPDTPARREE